MIRRCINGKGIDVYGDSSRLKELLYIKDFAAAVVRAADIPIFAVFSIYQGISLTHWTKWLMV